MGAPNNIKSTLIKLAAIAALAGTITGCEGSLQNEPSAIDADPFVDDRVATVRIVVSEEDWDLWQQTAQQEQYVRADFWFDDELIPDIGVRAKGNSSLRGAFQTGDLRFSMKIDFNLLNKARDFRGLKKVNLNNGWRDPTLLRERLSYEIFEQMGVPTPRSAFVDLWMNDTHLGVFTMVEQVDKTFLENHFQDARGNLYKPESTAASLTWTQADLPEQEESTGMTGHNESGYGLDINLGGGKLGEIMSALGQGVPRETEPAAQAQALPPGIQPNGLREPPPGFPPPPPGVQPNGLGEPPPGFPLPPPGAESDQAIDYLDLIGLKTNETEADHSALFRFLDILNNETDESFPTEIEKVLDVDGALRFFAVSTFIVHLDNYLGSAHNYYLYEVDGRFTILPWDLNEAFGTFNCGINRDGLVNFYIDEPTAGSLGNRPLVGRLLSHPSYLETYHGYLNSLLNGPLAAEEIEQDIDQLADLIRPYVELDDSKFFSTTEFELGISNDAGSSGVTDESSVRGIPRSGAFDLKTFVRERSESVRRQLDGTRVSSIGDGSGNRSTSRMCGGL